MNSHTNNQLLTITSAYLQEIVTRLVEKLHPEKVILFGSYAYGAPNQNSDIDLLVIVADSDQPRYRRSRLAYAALRGILIPTDVIVMTREEIQKKAGVQSSLVKQALDKGKVLYG